MGNWNSLYPSRRVAGFEIQPREARDFFGAFFSKITKFATKNSYETRSKLCPKLIMQHKKCNIFNSSRNNSLWRALCGKPKHIHWFSIYLATQSVNFSVHRFSVYLTIQSMRFYIHRFRFTSHWDRFSVYLTTQSSNCLFTHFRFTYGTTPTSSFLFTDFRFTSR